MGGSETPRAQCPVATVRWWFRWVSDRAREVREGSLEEETLGWGLELNPWDTASSDGKRGWQTSHRTDGPGPEPLLTPARAGADTANHGQDQPGPHSHSAATSVPLGVTLKGVSLAPHPGPRAFTEVLPQPDVTLCCKTDGRTWPRCSEQWLPLPTCFSIPFTTSLFLFPLRVTGLAHRSLLACESFRFEQGLNNVFPPHPTPQESEGQVRRRAKPLKAGAAARRRSPGQAPPSHLSVQRSLQGVCHVTVQVPCACAAPRTALS